LEEELNLRELKLDIVFIYNLHGKYKNASNFVPFTHFKKNLKVSSPGLFEVVRFTYIENVYAINYDFIIFIYHKIFQEQVVHEESSV